MSKLRLRIGKREVPPLAALAAAVLASVVFAAVFIYYPLGVTIKPVAPPVYFAPGTNANGTDLAGNTINVTLGANYTSAIVELHPTYQFAYYKDVLKVINNDPGNTSYYVYLKVTNANITNIPGADLYIIVSNGTNTAAFSIANPSTYNISATLGPLPAGGNWTISFMTLYPEGNKLETLVLQAYLVYTPVSSELPPDLPATP